MKNILSKGQLSLLIVLGILILDQVIKIEVKKLKRICFIMKAFISRIGFIFAL